MTVNTCHRWIAAALLALSMVLATGIPSRALPVRVAPVGAVTIGELALPAVLNPLLDSSLATRDVTDAVFDSLLSADTHDALVPDLATGYSLAADGRTYTFALNGRARWQDGVPVTASDVLYTAKLVRDPQFPAVSRYAFGYITSLRSDGPLTVIATLRQVYAPFLRAFATTPILPAHVLSPIADKDLAGYQAFNLRPIGSGPYAVTDVTPGDHITLTASSSFARGTPRIAQIVFKREGSSKAELAALQSGAIDMIGPSSSLTPQQVIPALQSGRYSAFAAPGSGWTHIDLIESGFLRDHEVRQALTLATPRQRIVSTLFGGLAAPADADQPPTSIYYDPSIAGTLPYAPGDVPGLLEKRGYTLVHSNWRKFGRDLAITLWTDSGCADCLAVAGTVASSWTSAGIRTTVKAVDQHKLFGLHGPLYNADRLYSQQLSAVLYTWAVSAEPDDTYYWATSMIVRPGHLTGGNFDGYSDAVVNRLSGQALITTDEQRRIAIYQHIQRLLVNDQPDVFLYWTAHLTITVDSLQGYRANPFAPGITWNVFNWVLA